MNILFLTQIIPYPPDAGPRVKTWNVLRYLVEIGHQVTLVSFIRDEEKPYLETVERLCSSVHTVPIKRSRLADILFMVRSQLAGRSFLIERDNLAAMRKLVKHLVETQPIDVIHADQLTMSQFALMGGERKYTGKDGKSPTLIFDAHNAVWTIFARMAETAPFFIKPIISLESRRVKRYEGQIVQQFDHTLAVTEQDCQALTQAEALDKIEPENKRPITIIPISVDAAQLQPVRRKPGSTNLITLGTLHYPPNADGIRWFVHDIFPIIRQSVPEVTLTIVGKNPPQDFLEFASQYSGSISVTGYIPDLVPYLESAAVMVVPVRAGGGMRVRILEAFARGMPVVTTTVGIEGIVAVPDQDVLVKDAPSDFAESVIRLLRDENLQERFAKNGRILAEKQYDRRVVMAKLNLLYQSIEEKMARA